MNAKQKIVRMRCGSGMQIISDPVLSDQQVTITFGESPDLAGDQMLITLDHLNSDYRPLGWQSCTPHTNAFLA